MQEKEFYDTTIPSLSVQEADETMEDIIKACSFFKLAKMSHDEANALGYSYSSRTVVCMGLSCQSVDLAFDGSFSSLPCKLSSYRQPSFSKMSTAKKGYQVQAVDMPIFSVLLTVIRKWRSSGCAASLRMT